MVFGQRITRQHNGRLQTTLEDLHLGQPVLRALFKHSVLKNYVRGGNTEFGGVDRVEVATNDVTDFRGILKGVENLPAVRERFGDRDTRGETVMTKKGSQTCGLHSNATRASFQRDKQSGATGIWSFQSQIMIQQFIRKHRRISLRHLLGKAPQIAGRVVGVPRPRFWTSRPWRVT